MESLDEAICLWVIRCGHYQFNAPHLGELFEQFRRELSSSVRRDRSGDAHGSDPTMREGVDDRLGGHVDHRYRDRPSRETVNSGEDVFVAIGQGKSDNVHIYVLETLVRNLERAYGRCRMTRHLRLLAGQTLSCPAARVFSDGGPDEF